MLAQLQTWEGETQVPDIKKTKIISCPFSVKRVIIKKTAAKIKQLQATVYMSVMAQNHIQKK
jgi:hypothetical protein